MPIISLKTGTKSRSLLVGNAPYDPTKFESIATFSATGSETTFTFTSIPSTYKHLQLRAIFQRNGGSQLDVGIRFNSDTGANYSQHYLSGDGAAVSASGSGSSSYISIGVGPGTATSNMFGVSIIDIHNYASTTINKTVRAAGGADTNNTGISAVRLWSGAWYNTSAISSLTIYPFGDAMNTGTKFALYGIKGELTMAITYEPIATTTLGTASATIVFSSISSAYTDLKLIMTFTGTSNQFDMRFNGDTGSNYSWTRLKGDGASATSNRGTSSSTIATNESAGASAPQFVNVDIFSYAGSTNKTALLSFTNDLNGSGSVGNIVGLWRNTAAINQITIIGSSYPIGTTATLYGIKEA